jgi:hypothetical protein
MYISRYGVLSTYKLTSYWLVDLYVETLAAHGQIISGGKYLTFCWGCLGSHSKNKGGDNMDKTLFSVVRFDASDTFAREVKSMTENGYDLLKVVDTPGYECLEGMALLVKSNHTFTEGQLEEIVCLFTQLPVHLETLIEG